MAFLLALLAPMMSAWGSSTWFAQLNVNKVTSSDATGSGKVYVGEDEPSDSSTYNSAPTSSGKIKGSGGKNDTSHKFTFNLAAQADYKSKFGGWFKDEAAKTLHSANASATYPITCTTKDNENDPTTETVYAKFIPNPEEYTLTLNKPAGLKSYTITGPNGFPGAQYVNGGEPKVYNGEKYTITCTPDDYHLFQNKWIVDGTEKTGSSITLTISGNTSMTPVFVEKEKYTATCKPAAGGSYTAKTAFETKTINSSDASVVDYDTLAVTLTALEPNDGYEFYRWCITGSDGTTQYSSNTPYTTTAVKDNITISAEYISAEQATEVADHTALVNALNNNSLIKVIIPNGKEITVAKGATLTVPSGKQLVVDGTLYVDGSLSIAGIVSGAGKLSKCFRHYVQTGENGASGSIANPFAPYPKDGSYNIKYWVTKGSTPSSSVSVSGSGSNGMTVLNHVTFINGRGDEIRNTPVSSTASLTILTYNVDSSVAMNHVTSFRSSYDTPANAYTAGASAFKVLTADATYVGEASSKYSHSWGITDCAGYGLTLSSELGGGSAFKFINGSITISGKVQATDCWVIKCSKFKATSYHSDHTKNQAFRFFDTESSGINIAASMATGGDGAVFYSGTYDFSFDGKSNWKVYGGLYKNDPTDFLAQGLNLVATRSPEHNNYYLVYTYIPQKVVQVGNDKENQFEKLQDAINAATDGQTIKLITNFTLREAVTIAAGKSVTIDLNGYGITNSTGSIVVENKGTLSIGNFAGDGGVCAATIINNGSVDVTYGTYSGAITLNAGMFTVHNGNFTGALATGSGVSDPTSVVALNGGRFKNSVEAFLGDGYDEVLRNGMYQVEKFPYAIKSAGSLSGAEKSWSLTSMKPEDRSIWLTQDKARSAFSSNADWNRYAELDSSLSPYIDFTIDCVLTFDRAVGNGSVKAFANAKVNINEALDRNLAANEEYRVLTKKIATLGSGWYQINFNRFLKGDDCPTTVSAGVADVNAANVGTVATLELQLCHLNKSTGVYNKDYAVATCRYMLDGKKAAIDRGANRLAYDSLAAAVSAANSGETVIVGADTDENVMLPGAGTYTIDPYGFAFTGTVSVPSGCTILSTSEANSAVVAQGVESDKKVTYVVEASVTAVDAPTAVSGLVYDGTEKTGVAAGTGYTLSGNTATAAGSYTATATLEEGYVWSDDSSEAKEISWSIGKASLTATAENKSVIRGETVPYTITYSGFVNGEDATALTSAPTASCTYNPTDFSASATSYAITLSGGSAVNYDITLNNGTLTVTPCEAAIEQGGGTSYVTSLSEVVNAAQDNATVAVMLTTSEPVAVNEMAAGKTLTVTPADGVTAHVTVTPADGAFIETTTSGSTTTYESKKITVEMKEPTATVAVTKIDNGTESDVTDTAEIAAAVAKMTGNKDVPRTDNTDKLDVLDKITVTPTKIVEEVKGGQTVIRSATFDVTPNLNAGQSLAEGQKLKFRLPVDADATQLSAIAYHNAVQIDVYPVATENGEKFIEVAASDFSPYGYELLDGETANPVAAIGTTGYATFDDAIAAANSQNVDEITILNGATESPDAAWKVADGKLVRKTYVAKIGETKYETIDDLLVGLQTAIAGGSYANTITFLADVELADNFVIPQEMAQCPTTFDLNGKHITLAADKTHAIRNYGQLTLVDSVGGGSVTAPIPVINESGATFNMQGGTLICNEQGRNAVQNRGTFNMTDGSLRVSYVGSSSDPFGSACLSNSGTATITKGSLTSVNQRAYAIVNSGTLTINPAADSDVAVTGAHGAVAVDGGTVSISGGSYTATNYYALYVSNEASNPTVTVTGGTFDGNAYSAYIGSDVNESVTASVAISGGTFNDPIIESSKVADGSGFAISGGNFTTAVAEGYCATGYIPAAQDPETGMYTVKEAVTVTFVNEKGDEPAAQVIAKGKTAVEPTPAPTAENALFEGWFAENAEAAFDFATPVTADLTLTAKWTEYVVTLTPQSSSIKVGNTVSLKVAIAKNGVALNTTALYSAEKSLWTLEADPEYLSVTKGPTAYASYIQYTLQGVKAGTTTVTYRNVADPTLAYTATVAIAHNLTVTFASSDIGTASKGAIVEAGPVAITSVKLDGVEVDRTDYTFTSEDATIVTVDAQAVTPVAAGVTYVNVTSAADPAITVRKYVKIIPAVAKIGDTYYGTIAKAMNAAASGDTVELCRDVTESVDFSGNTPRVSDFSLTVDLAGHTWTGAANQSYALRVDYGTVTVKDTVGGGGVAYGKDYAFIVGHLAGDYTSKLVLESGTFRGKTSVAQVGYPGGSGANMKYYGGTLEVLGGTFEAVLDEGETLDADGHLKYLLNELDFSASAYPGGEYNPSEIVVKGGSFKQFDPADNVAEGADTSFLPATGYVSVADDPSSGWYTVYEAVTVTFVNEKGDAPEAQVIGKGKTAVKPADPAEVPGFLFNGWTLNGAAYDFATPVTENIELVAVWDKAVAKVTSGGTDTFYATLAAAVAAAQEGDTVTLLADISLTDRLFVNAGATPAYAGSNNRYATTSENKAITLDMNGKDITSASNIALAGGSLSITGTGTISTTNDGLAPIEVRGTGDLANKRALVIGEDVVLDGGSYGLNVFGSNDAQKNIIDVTVNGTVNGTLFVLGNLKNTENAINIVVNGTVAAKGGTSEDVNVGIALNGNANVTVNDGATVNGDSGIEVRAGTLTVNGGTITGTAETYSYNPNGSGCTTKGAAVAVAQHSTALDTAVKLNGGTLDGVKAIGVTDVNGNMDNVSVVATQGYTQSSAIPDDYKWVETETTGVYTLAPKDYVAQIVRNNEVVAKYESLEEAIAAAQDGDTVKLLADCAGNGIKFPQGKFGTAGIAVDFDRHTYTVDGATVGSAGTETNGFQLLKDNKITFRNGTITSSKAKILIQNYSDLTLDRMTLTLDNPSYVSAYTLSNNNGDIVVNDSTINANPAGGFAFDVCRYASYPSVSVTVQGESVINGDVEVSASGSDAKDGFSLALNGGTMTGRIVMDASASAALAAAPEKVSVTKSTNFVEAAPDGYVWVAGATEGTETIAKAVASIGTASYATLEAAFAAAQDGETVKLLADITLSDRLFVNAGATPAYAGSNNRYATTSDTRSITLDMNGKNITSSSNIALAGGSLSITGTGTISTTNDGLAPIEVRGTGDLANKRALVIGEDVVLDGGSYGLNVFGSNDAQKNIIDVTVNGTVNGTLFVLGNLKNTENAINIVVNGTVAAKGGTSEDVNVGIALNGNANVTVNDGATVNGDSGIEVRAGTLTVNGGTISATSQEYSYKPNGSGCTTKGAAIAVAQHGTALDTAVTLNGGTLNGVKTIGVTDVNGNMDNVEVLATQGYTEGSSIPDDYKWVETTTAGVYTLAPKDYVAQIVRNNEVVAKYESLDEALKAAQDGDTVQLLADVEESVTIEKNITLAGEYKITGVTKVTAGAEVAMEGVALDANGQFYALDIVGGATVNATGATFGGGVWCNVHLNGGSLTGEGVTMLGDAIEVSADGTTFTYRGETLPASMAPFGMNLENVKGETVTLPFMDIVRESGTETVELADAAGKPLAQAGSLLFVANMPGNGNQSGVTLPARFGCYTLTIEANLVILGDGSTPTTGWTVGDWNEIIDTGSAVLDAIGEDSTEVPVELALNGDVELAGDGFEFRNPNLTIDGNGNALSGTIKYTDNAGLIHDIELGTADNALVLDMTGVGKPIEIGSGIVVENVIVKMTPEQATAGTPVIIWDAEHGVGAPEKPENEPGVTVALVDAQGTPTGDTAELTWDDELGMAYIGPCEARLTGLAHDKPIYTSLANAISLAAQSGDTVTLLMDITGFSGTQKIEKSLTLDGDGHTITAATTASSTGAMFDVHGENVVFENLTINGDHRYWYCVEAHGGNLALQDMTILNGAQRMVADDAENPQVGYGSAVHVNGANLSVSGTFKATGGGKEAGVFPFTEIIYSNGKIHFEDDVVAEIGDDLLLVGFGPLNVAEYLASADVAGVLEQMNIPGGYIPYSLTLGGSNSDMGFIGASPRTWNTIVDYGKEIMEVATESGIGGFDMDPETTPAEVGLMTDTVIPGGGFTYQDANFSVNGNGNALSGTIVFKDEADGGMLRGIALGKTGDENALVLDLRQTTKPIDLGAGVAIDNVVVLMTEEQASKGKVVFDWDAADITGDDIPAHADDVVVTIVNAEGESSGEPKTVEWDEEQGLGYIGPCEARLTGLTHDAPIYTTLANAIALAADSGDTVTLLMDISLTDRLFVNAGAEPMLDSKSRYATTSENKSITLDMNGFDITSSSNIALAGGSLNITGKGTISTTNDGLAPVEVRGSGDLASKRTLTIGKDVTLNGGDYGLNVFGSNSAQKNLIDVTVNGTVNGTLFVLGNLTNADNEINIVVNGTVAAGAGTAENVSVGIALNGNANVTVNSPASVSGESGIEVRAGSLTVNGGTITATASDYSYNPTGDGCTTKGAAVAVAQHETLLPTSVLLNGGSLVGEKTIGVTDVNNNMDDVSVVATEGYTMNSSIPFGYEWVETETEGFYTLDKMTCVVQIVGAATGAIELSGEIPVQAGQSLTYYVSINGGAWSAISTLSIPGSALPASGTYATLEYKAVITEGTKSVDCEIGGKVGILHVKDEACGETTIIGVPWLPFGEKTTVDSLVYLGNRSDDDEIMAYDADAGLYRSWYLENGSWKPYSTSGGTPVVASEVVVVRGQGFRLYREDVKKPIYLIGRAPEAEEAIDAVTVFPGGTDASPAWTLAAAPSNLDLDLNAGNSPFASGTTDTIVVMTPQGVNVPYTFENGKWGCMKSVQKTRKSGATYWVTERVNEAVIPAGTGFWYVNGGDVITVEW